MSEKNKCKKCGSEDLDESQVWCNACGCNASGEPLKDLTIDTSCPCCEGTGKIVEECGDVESSCMTCGGSGDFGCTQEEYKKDLMNKRKLESVKIYQCPGCVLGEDDCYKECEGKSIECSSHVAGTMGSGIGKFYLGLPKGFNRFGAQKKLQLKIYETQKDQEDEWKYDEFNVSVWKYKTNEGHILIRGYMPRINEGFIHVILDGDYESIRAHKIDISDID